MLTGVVLTHNEAEDLPRCLESLHFCDHLLVIDDHSTDKTVEIASSLGAQVISRALSGDFSAQRNFALSRVKSGWVLFVDADEEVNPSLATEILLNIKPSTLNTGYYIPRVDFLWGKRLKYGDSGHIKLIRLGQVGAWTGKVHETWQVPGQIGELRNQLYHYPHPTLYAFLRHINNYSTLRASELHDQGHKTNLFEIVFYPVLKFFYLGIWKLGFLDGTIGFIHAMVMSFYTFLVRGKLWLLWR